jgi:hypothetical protein
MSPQKLRLTVFGLLVLCLGSLLLGFGLSALVALCGAWACSAWLWDERCSAAVQWFKRRVIVDWKRILAWPCVALALLFVANLVNEGRRAIIRAEAAEKQMKKEEDERFRRRLYPPQPVKHLELSPEIQKRLKTP